jgi:hypothetical protein
MPHIEQFLPRPRLHQVERRPVWVDPVDAWPAVRSIDTFEVPLFRALIALS